jgi:hypothetical protein
MNGIILQKLLLLFYYYSLCPEWSLRDGNIRQTPSFDEAVCAYYLLF